MKQILVNVSIHFFPTNESDKILPHVLDDSISSALTGSSCNMHRFAAFNPVCASFSYSNLTLGCHVLKP